MSRVLTLVSVSVTVLVVVAACGSDPDSAFLDGNGDAGTSSGDADPSTGFGKSDAAGDAGPTLRATPVDVVFTADNAYKFGWGTAGALASMQGSPSNPGAGEIFPCPVGKGPEAYEVPAAEAPVDGYLYVVAWDDHDNTQGALGQFKRRETDKVVYSGDAAWEVCATGLVYDARKPDAQGPPLDVVNQELARCNDGTGDKSKTSGGWVNSAGAVTPGAVGKLMVGEDNSKGYEDGVFPITCQKDETGKGIDPGARWMWYSSDGEPHFQNDPDPRSFLIFRLPNTAVPPPPVK